MSLSSQPNEEPMRNKERKVETLPLASHKVKREPATLLLFFHISVAAPLLNCMLSIEFRLKPKG